MRQTLNKKRLSMLKVAHKIQGWCRNSTVVIIVMRDEIRYLNSRHYASTPETLDINTRRARSVRT